jgi:hypothetical protein
MLLSLSNDNSKMASLAFFDDISDFSIQKALAIIYPHDKTRDKNSTEKLLWTSKGFPSDGF